MAISTVVKTGVKAGVKASVNFLKKPEVRKGLKKIAAPILQHAGKVIIEKSKNFIDNIFKNKITKEDNKKISKKIAENGAFDKQEASQEQILNFDKFLDNIREENYQKLDNIEKYTIDFIRMRLEEITKIIENDFKPYGIEINIDSIKYKFENLINLFKNSFSNGVIRHIALSDSKMEKILKIKDNNKRQNDINEYIDKLVENATKNYCSNLDNITKESLKIIGDTVNDYLNNTENSIKNITEEIENNAKLNIREIETKRKEYENKAKLLEEFISILD